MHLQIAELGSQLTPKIKVPKVIPQNKKAFQFHNYDSL